VINTPHYPPPRAQNSVKAGPWPMLIMIIIAPALRKTRLKGLLKYKRCAKYVSTPAQSTRSRQSRFSDSSHLARTEPLHPRNLEGNVHRRGCSSLRLETTGIDGLDLAMILKKRHTTVTCPDGPYRIEDRDTALVANLVDDGARLEKQSR